jgi:iron complex outermembrane receptor protein
VQNLRSLPVSLNGSPDYLNWKMEGAKFRKIAQNAASRSILSCCKHPSNLGCVTDNLFLLSVDWTDVYNRTKKGRLLVLLLFVNLTQFLSAQTDTTLPLPPVTIRDARFDQTGYAAWHADSLPMSGAMNLSDRLLWENPVAVRANAPGTLATVSARGAGPSRTPVFWNGVNLQSPQNGVVDASLLPLWPGDRLEVRYGGQSAAQSAGAMGGSVMLEPNFSLEDGFSGMLGGAMGSFGRKDALAALGFSQKNITSQARVSWQQANNDFPYKNTAQIGQPDVRQANNRVEKLDIQQFNRFICNEKNTVKTAFWRQRAFREIPPAMTEAPSETWQRDRSTRIVSSWEHSPHTRSLWQTRAAWMDEAIFFNLRGDVDSSRARTALLSSEYSAVAGQHFTWKTGGTAIRQWAQADGYADTSHWYGQTRLAGFGMAEWRLRNGRLTTLARQEWSRGLGEAAPFTWSVGGQLDWKNAGSLRFHVSRNFNLPTFNDRFWLEYGKADLKPEKGYSGDAGWVFKKNGFSAEVTAFQVLLDDWILWQPGADGIFRPDNLRKVWSRGVELNGNWKLEIRNWKLGISGRYQYLKATNAAVYDGSESVLNKQLPYTPNHSAGAVLKVERGWFSVAYLHQWTGQQFTTSDNLNVLEGFSTGNLLVRFHPTPAPSPTGRGDVEHSAMSRPPLPVGEGSGVGWALDFRLENIWNTPYQIIAYRPMPGRSFRIGLTFNW